MADRSSAATPSGWFVPEGDRQCGVKHTPTGAACMKRQGHDGEHATPQGHWIDGPWCEYPDAAAPDRSSAATPHAPDCNCHRCEPYTEWLGDETDASPDREPVSAEARELRRDIIASLIAVKGHLDQPYPDDPRWTPWTRFIERTLRKVDELAALASARGETT